MSYWSAHPHNQSRSNQHLHIWITSSKRFFFFVCIVKLKFYRINKYGNIPRWHILWYINFIFFCFVWTAIDTLKYIFLRESVHFLSKSMISKQQSGSNAEILEKQKISYGDFFCDSINSLPLCSCTCWHCF